MSFKDCLEFINKNPACTLATIDGNQPRVRGMFVLWANQDGIYFTTAKSKKLCSELNSNSNAELCFFTAKPLKSLRVTGKVEFVEDLNLKEKALEERPWLKAFGSGEPDDPNFGLIRLSHGEAFFFTMENNARESEIPRIKF